MRYFTLTLFFLLISSSIFPQCDFTIEPVSSTGCMVSNSEAVFTDLVRTSFVNGVVRKTSSSSQNGGAFSTAAVRNNGYAETVIHQGAKHRVFGLSHSNTNINEVEYGFSFGIFNFVEVIESSASKKFLWFYSIGDKYKIAVENGIVKYYQNDNLVYESSKIPTLPLYVDLVMQDKDAEIKDVRIVNESSTTIRAFSNQNSATIATYKWFQNGVQLTGTGSEITLTNFYDGDVIKCTAIPISGACAGMLLKSNSMVLKMNSVPPALDFNISATPANQSCLMASQNVMWKANIPDNIEINNGNVTKISGYSTSNGGIYSESFVFNNGYLEFQTAETNSRKMVGLSSVDGGNHESTIQYAIYMSWGGGLTIYENGTWKANAGNMNTGNKLRIHVDNGIVKYYKDQELLYVSAQLPNLPLIADGTLQDIGTTITKAIIANPTDGEFTVSDNSVLTGLNWKLNGQTTGFTGSSVYLDDLSDNDIITCSYILSQVGCGSYIIQSNSIKISKNQNLAPHQFYIEGIQELNGSGIAEEQVVWNPESLANVSNINNNLKKIQGYGSFNAGASSLNTVKNNGYFDFQVSEKNRRKSIGLSSTDLDYNYNSVDYSMLLASNGKFSIYEKQNYRLGNISYNVGDVLRIAVENNVVKYYRNQTLLYTSNLTPNLPLLVDVALADEGGTIQNAVVGNKNDKKFTAHVTGLGAAPEFTWFINGNSTGNQGSLFTADDIGNNDKITCTVKPDFTGCTNSTEFESNYILFIGPPTLTDWLGTVSTAWHNGANWSEGVPNTELSARISAGRPRNPKITTVQSVKNVVVESNAKLTMGNESSLVVYGDFTINGELNAGNGKIVFSGSANQRIAGNNLKFNELVVNLSNPAKSLLLLSPIYIVDETVFITGKIKTLDHEVVYLHGSETRNGHKDSFIDGSALKIGKSKFTFPVGSGNIYAPIKISAPVKTTDAFRAVYMNEDPNTANYSTLTQDGSFASASTCEYWMLDRVQGQSAVKVSLSYENERSCGITDPDYLQVAHWNGEQWENMGLGDLEGDAESGMITSENQITSFSPFTLGSRSHVNPLPIQLSSFSVLKEGQTAIASWQTESEMNNAYFTIERSENAVDFETIKIINGAGTSHQRNNYRYIDKSPSSGLNYYRLSQTDFDGKQTFFDLKTVYFDPPNGITVYPNPNKGSFKIERKSNHKVSLSLIDMYGKIRWQQVTNQLIIQADIQNLIKGIYLLHIDDGQTRHTEKVVIQ